jgi:hypothetical protein
MQNYIFFANLFIISSLSSSQSFRPLQILARHHRAVSCPARISSTSDSGVDRPFSHQSIGNDEVFDKETLHNPEVFLSKYEEEKYRYLPSHQGQYVCRHRIYTSFPSTTPDQSLGLTPSPINSRPAECFDYSAIKRDSGISHVNLTQSQIKNLLKVPFHIIGEELLREALAYTLYSGTINK